MPDQLSILQEQVLAQKAEDRLDVLLKIIGSPEIKNTPQEFDYLQQAYQASVQYGNDTDRAHCQILLGDYFTVQRNVEEALKNYHSALELFSKTDDKLPVANINAKIGKMYLDQFSYVLSMEYLIKATKLYEELNEKSLLASPLNNIAMIYVGQGNHEDAIGYFLKAEEINKEYGNKRGLTKNYGNLSHCYLYLGKLDEALMYIQKAFSIRTYEEDKLGFASYHNTAGYIYAQRGEYKEGLDHSLKSLSIFEELKNDNGISFSCSTLGLLYLLINEYGNAEKYLSQGYELAVKVNQRRAQHTVLGNWYKLKKAQGDPAKALEYLEKYALLDKELIDAATAQRVSTMESKADLERKEKETEIERLKNVELKKAYEDLKAAQEKLVMQEKLASLGKLTAGIAHEIQNPLNFVNNFSELSVELIDEFLNSTDENEKLEIARDLQSNLGKIKQHGKRADQIVKNMLLHSRSSNQQYAPADINSLCAEYINLAYHAKRTTSPEFKCSIVLNLEENLPPINAIGQDIGRVLLNLFANAFDAVQPASKPEVQVTTKQNGPSISVIVKDNGEGIPEDIKEKIFEPFFTTKPTGSGTGLGLSISFDIIKAHGGEIRIESEAGLGTEFTVILPINQ